MRIDIISVVPELLQGPMDHSIVKRAREAGMLDLRIHNLRDHAINEYGQVDDYPYGGGAGMVLRCEPLSEILDELLAEREYQEVIYTTPDGGRYNQGTANRLSLSENLIIICGHYKGIDQRIRDIYVTKEISIGDFVLTGGEIPAALIVDSLVRLIPGVIGDETSALTDSFQDGLLAPPVYTRPEDFKGHRVPDVLMSGNHQAVEQWRNDMALEITRIRRPDLLEEE